MKKQLSNDYDISVDNMLNMTADQEANKFKVKRASFFNMKGKKVPMDILVRENKDYSIEQIFAMKDGTFILETEKDMEITYYFSRDLNDLIK